MARRAGHYGIVPGSGNSSDSPFNLEIILLDYFRQVARCFVLLEAKFTEAENLVDHPLRKGLELIGFGNGLLLEHVEFGWRVWAREG
jgi:hypothetical protein